MPDGATPTPQIHQTDISEELSGAYLAYSMSVIVGRALPDARDGLKPVHRRIMYAMKAGGYAADKPYRKSARIVGDVMGQFHPHGDSAIYDAMARMAQHWSMRMPLIDGQGNFGSMDGDPPAAMRYTEARLARAASALLDEIDKDTVDWEPNYDNSQEEPSVLPAGVPNLLINGSEGIAVGMATRIPPHNPAEAIRAAIAVLEDPEVSLAELMEILPGPDFPTGGVIMGLDAIRKAYETGRNSIAVRARHVFEDASRGRRAIVFTEMPFQVNKARVYEKINELAKEKQIEGLQEVRDESDRDGIRLVCELKRDANEEVVLARLHKLTDLQTSFPVNILALDHNLPRQMSLKEVLTAFVDFRRSVVRKRTLHDLRKARARAHVVAGLLAAIANIDRVIELIRAAPDADAAREALVAERFELGELAEMLAKADPKSDIQDGACRLTTEQAKAILDLRLHRLTGLEREKLEAESRELIGRINHYVDVLSDSAVLKRVMREELEAQAAKLSEPRRTDIEEDFSDYDVEDLIPREEMVVCLTNGGYVKRVPLKDYRSQKRNGKGRSGMETKDDDFVTRIISASTHTPLLFFTAKGLCYKLKVYQLPQGAPQGRGRPLVNLIPKLDRDDSVAAVLAMPEEEAAYEQLHAVFVTEQGNARRNTLADFARVPSNGKIAMKFGEDVDGRPDDRLVNVLLHESDQHVALCTEQGMVIRFPAADVRVFSGRSAIGVRGIKLKRGDRVVSAMILDDAGTAQGEPSAFLARAAAERRQDASDGEAEVPEVDLDDARYEALKAREQVILTVTTAGFGRRTSSFAYRVTGRGGVGVRDKSSNDKVGRLVGAMVVAPEQEVMLTTNAGQMIRTPVEDIRFTGRGAAGVKLFRLGKGEEVVSFAPVEREQPDEDEPDAAEE